MNQVSISFPNGNKKQFPNEVTGLEIAKSISKSLSKNSLAIKVDGKLQDLSIKINKDSAIEIITISDHEIALEIIRHDAAHLMAQAVKELFPDSQVTIGPAIKDGFYYDFATPKPFTPDDLVKIEKKMQQIVKRNDKIIREIWDRNKAINFFKSIGEKYKAKIIGKIPQNEKITLYRQGDFIDLCRGPHSNSTAQIKYFKLLKISGAYWEGDSKNKMLQRIYGTAWHSKEALDQYLHQLEESKKRDHRKLGKEMELFHIDEEAVGSIYWHHDGYVIYREIENYIRQRIDKDGYLEVKTPQMIDRNLWEKSGHWDKFRENMFIAESEDRILAIKPMNCPAHIQIFNQKIKSYRDLPLKISEFGCCHRNEPSGALHGIMRVRSFVQDDAHIFCEKSQINSETKNFCDLLKSVYRDFGFNEINVKFSTRPQTRAGTDKIWDEAEASLEQAVKETGIEYQINEGEGAFYGPKIEFILIDALGRHWQCGTLQVDFILPQRLNAIYVDKNGKKQHPILLHRAILGSFERFIGILIENFAGKLPLWLAPKQIMIAPISQKFNDYGYEILNKLKESKLRAFIDDNDDKISYKIRNHSLKKIPYILIVGENEEKNQTITIRKIGSNDQQSMKLQEFLQILDLQIKMKI